MDDVENNQVEPGVESGTTDEEDGVSGESAGGLLLTGGSNGRGGHAADDMGGPEYEAPEGATPKEAFAGLLAHKFGNVVRAWVAALVPTSPAPLVASLDFVNFCEACREVDYDGNLKKLWTELQPDTDDLVTLAALDPKADEGLRQLVGRLEERFPGPTPAKRAYAAWTALDGENKGRLTREVFTRDGADILGFDLAFMERCFDWLASPGEEGLTLVCLVGPVIASEVASLRVRKTMALDFMPSSTPSETLSLPT